MHHEVELGIVIGADLSNLAAEDEKSAMDVIDGYFVAIDLTARNIQDECKKKGLPWTTAKGFDTFCPVSRFIPKEKVSDPHDVYLWLDVNQVRRQSDNSSLMLFRIPRLLSEISRVMRLEPGDLILTGTPKGVGEIGVGDSISAGIKIEGLDVAEGAINVDVRQREDGYTHDSE